MKIGVFDSGIGGLTVLTKLIEKYPNCEYIYYGDTANAPFGNKTIDEFKIIAENIINFLIEQKVDIIVIACGTISSNLKEYLVSKYDIPIFDIISGTINYINSSNYESIGILCTEATKNSGIFNNIKKDVQVLSCPPLATLIENSDSNIDNYIKEITSNLNNKDLIVLGCIHYPLIIDTIKKYAKSDILDMSDYINININEESNFKLELYFSNITDLLLDNVSRILKNYKHVIKNK